MIEDITKKIVMNEIKKIEIETSELKNNCKVEKSKFKTSKLIKKSKFDKNKFETSELK